VVRPSSRSDESDQAVAPRGGRCCVVLVGDVVDVIVVIVVGVVRDLSPAACRPSSVSSMDSYSVAV
jgi:hypothetical protein